MFQDTLPGPLPEFWKKGGSPSASTVVDVTEGKGKLSPLLKKLGRTGQGRPWTRDSSLVFL